MRSLVLTIFGLLTSCAVCLAWPGVRGCAWGYWNDDDWNGSGRDYPYSYYVDMHGSQAADVLMTPPESVAPLALPTSASDAQGNEFTVNIPNGRGGYTSVVLKRSGMGFVGPKGEFYPEFPKVWQLQAKYTN